MRQPATTPLPLLLLLPFWLSSPTGICFSSCLSQSSPLSSRTDRPENRHLDRSDSQLHREWRRGDTPAFRLLLLLLFSSPQKADEHRMGFTFAPAVVFAFAFLVVIPKGICCRPLFLRHAANVHRKNISRIFRPKIACQAPKPPNSLNPKQIELAY